MIRFSPLLLSAVLGLGLGCAHTPKVLECSASSVSAILDSITVVGPSTEITGAARCWLALWRAQSGLRGVGEPTPEHVLSLESALQTEDTKAIAETLIRADQVAPGVCRP